MLACAVAWVPFVLFGVAVAILGLDPWLARRAQRAAERDDGLQEIAARRGPATARWLRSTMLLREALLALAEHAGARWTRERERAGEPRTVGRQIDDSKLLARIEPVRAAAVAWIAEAQALPPSERRALVELDIDPDALAPRLALRWGTRPVDERRSDRSDEIAAVRDDCRAAAEALRHIEQRLRATVPAPYR
jgi:hypothetical protein